MIIGIDCTKCNNSNDIVASDGDLMICRQCYFSENQSIYYQGFKPLYLFL